MIIKFKIFENIHIDDDPYNEENWENEGTSVFDLIMNYLKFINAQNIIKHEKYDGEMIDYIYGDVGEIPDFDFKITARQITNTNFGTRYGVFFHGEDIAQRFNIEQSADMNLTDGQKEEIYNCMRRMYIHENH